MGEKTEPYKGISVIYDEIRPSYPERLIQDIICKTDLKISDRLLEIGAGTGKATIQFAEKGFTIHAIELGEDMAEILNNKCISYPKVLVDVASFEDWTCTNNHKFDMIYSAQAFHWLDTNIKYKKCHKLLKDNGFLVLFWYNPCDVTSPVTQEMEGKVGEIVKRYAFNYSIDKGKTERRIYDGALEEDEKKAEIEASGLFKLVQKIEYTQETSNNANQYLKAKKSVPAFASILDRLDNKIIKKMDTEIEEVINNYGGYVSTVFKFSLYITKKISHD